MRVGNETRAWREGQPLLFDDSFEHAAVNRGHSPRVVFVADLWHPDLVSDAERLEALGTDASLRWRYTRATELLRSGRSLPEEDLMAQFRVGRG